MQVSSVAEVMGNIIEKLDIFQSENVLEGALMGRNANKKYEYRDFFIEATNRKVFFSCGVVCL